MNATGPMAIDQLRLAAHDPGSRIERRCNSILSIATRSIEYQAATELIRNKIVTSRIEQPGRRRKTQELNFRFSRQSGQRGDQLVEPEAEGWCGKFRFCGRQLYDRQTFDRHDWHRWTDAWTRPRVACYSFGSEKVDCTPIRR